MGDTPAQFLADHMQTCEYCNMIKSTMMLLKYVHIELAFCFLVTNYVYPNKTDRLTYHSIAKVAPVLSAKSPRGLVAPAVRYIVYAYSHTCLWHTLDLEESRTHCTVIKFFKNLQVTCFYVCMIEFHHPQTCNN